MRDPRASTAGDAMRMMMERMAKGLYVAMPGRVDSYNAETQSVNVWPLPKLIYPGMAHSDMFDFPMLYSVPVQWPRVDSSAEGGPKAIMYMPIMKGSLVLLTFSDFSLTNFLLANENAVGETYDPQDTRNHDLNDAIAIPGIFPFVSKVATTDSSKGEGGPTVDPHDIRLVLEWAEKNIQSEVYLGGDTGDIVLNPSRNCALGGPKASNLPVPLAPLKSWLQAIVGQLEALCDAITGATYGGNPIDVPAPINTIKAELTSLMTRFDEEDPPLAKNSFGVSTNKVLIP